MGSSQKESALLPQEKGSFQNKTSSSRGRRVHLKKKVLSSRGRRVRSKIKHPPPGGEGFISKRK
jgi:hypothetical protein